MPLVKFKYNINHHISLLPRELTAMEVGRTLESQYGISQSVFDADRFMPPGSSTRIPGRRLRAYAHVLRCPVKSLMNSDKAWHKLLPESYY